MKLTLKTKMLGAVSLLATLAILLAFIGTATLSKIEQETDEISVTSHKQTLTSDARFQLMYWLRTVEFLTASNLTPAQISKLHDHQEGAYTALNADIDALLPLLVFETSRQNIGTLRGLISEYTSVSKQANALYDDKKFDDVESLVVASADIGRKAELILADILDANNKLQSTAFQDGQRHIHEGRVQLLWISLIGIIAFVGLALWVILLGVIRPLAAVSTAIDRVAGGDIDATVPGTGRSDEIGRLAAALETFKHNAQEKKRLEADQHRQKLATEAEKRQLMNQLADGFEGSVRSVVDSVSTAAHQLQADAQGLSATADQTNRQACAVAGAAEQASENVEAVAAATEELSSSVSEIGRQISESSRIATVAVDEANKTNVTVASLSEAAQKIGEVVGLINDIASQTNLLALNATIEAARAGEAGKGFAVVASEVKNLANQTAKATDDIQVQVGQMQAVTGTAVSAIQNISGTIRRMSEITTTIASAVEQQGAATREIAKSVQQASHGTQEVSSNIGGVTQAAGETGQMAGSVLGAATELTAQAARLRCEVDTFVDRVRRA